MIFWATYLMELSVAYPFSGSGVPTASGDPSLGAMVVASYLSEERIVNI